MQRHFRGMPPDPAPRPDLQLAPRAARAGGDALGGLHRGLRDGAEELALAVKGIDACGDHDRRAEQRPAVGDVAEHHDAENDRKSEEHTSELQSLMRISYAVFCLKKKNKNKS